MVRTVITGRFIIISRQLKRSLMPKTLSVAINPPAAHARQNTSLHHFPQCFPVM